MTDESPGLFTWLESYPDNTNGPGLANLVGLASWIESQGCPVMLEGKSLRVSLPDGTKPIAFQNNGRFAIWFDILSETSGFIDKNSRDEILESLRLIPGFRVTEDVDHPGPSIKTSDIADPAVMASIQDTLHKIIERAAA